MTATVPTLRIDRHSGTEHSGEKGWGKNGHSDPVARLVAPQIGLTPLSAEQLLKGPNAINLRCSHFIRGFRELGDELRLQRFVRPMLAAYGQREAPPLVPATWQIAEDSDAREECAETAYLTDPSDANLERLIRASEVEIQNQDARLLALYVERDRRRRMVRA